MKIEVWNDCKIRFIEKDNEWWAVGSDVAKALKYSIPHKAVREHCKGVLIWNIQTNGGKQEVLIIPEVDIYNLTFKAADQSKSKKVKEKAEEFKIWVFEVLKKLRQEGGLESYQIFYMFDKNWQKEQMKKLKEKMAIPNKTDYIKANTIADKATSNKYGFSKMIKKSDMTPEMLEARQKILQDTVELMAVKDKFGLNISISEEIYKLV